MKILYVLPSVIEGNGVLTFCWNYLRNMPKEVTPSVLSIDDRPSREFLDFCHAKNISIDLLPNPTKIGFVKFKRCVANYFRQNHDFDIVHCNVPNYGFIFLKEARKNGIKVRIFHSHNTRSSDSKLKKIPNRLGMIATRKEANVYFACSEVAGRFAFGKKPFFFIPNAIDQTLFRYSKESRETIRKVYGINEKSFVIGFVGRLANQKNPLFLLNVFSQYHAKRPDSFLFILGDGPLRGKMEQKINKLSLTDFVIFAGSKPDASMFYSAFDVFLLPSLFEGLPFSGVEVQTTGIPCIFSTGSNQQLIFRNNAELLPLSEGPSKWSDEIENIAKANGEYIKGKNQFNIVEQSQSIVEIYKSILQTAKN
jgi:glycosyltransferase involved in cell wall biosynthesis